MIGERSENNPEYNQGTIREKQKKKSKVYQQCVGSPISKYKKEIEFDRTWSECFNCAGSIRCPAESAACCVYLQRERAECFNQSPRLTQCVSLTVCLVQDALVKDELVRKVYLHCVNDASQLMQAC